MRRLIAMLLALVVALSLVGCIGYTEEDMQNAYNEGYDDGAAEAESRYEDGYNAGYEEATLIYYEPAGFTDNYYSGYEDGFYEGYWEGVNDAMDGLHG